MSNDESTPHVSRPDEERALCLELGLAIPERVMSIQINVNPHDLVTATVVLQVPKSLAKRLFVGGDTPAWRDQTMVMTDEDSRRIRDEFLAKRDAGFMVVLPDGR
jgi:hypothetical protein